MAKPRRLSQKISPVKSKGKAKPSISTSKRVKKTPSKNSSRSDKFSLATETGSFRNASRGGSRSMPTDGSSAPKAKAKPLARNRMTTRGLGLSKKISIIVISVSAIITMTTGFVISSYTEKFVNDEILKSGLEQVGIMASFGRSFLDLNFSGKEKSYSELKAKVDKSLERAQFDDLLVSQFEREGLESTLIDAQISISDPTLSSGKERFIFSIAPLDGAGKINITENSVIQQLSKEGIRVSKGTVAKEGQAYTIPVYIFTQDLNIDLSPKFEEGGYRPQKGKARLFLSTVKINESSSAVFRLTAIILAISVFISILVALMLSKSITSPIKALVADMSIVAQGDLDHKTTPRSTDEVGYLATTFNHLTQSLRVAHEAEIRQEKFKHELEVGREIQRTLLPKTNPTIPGYDLDAFYLAANEVGGDYYDFIVVDKSHLGIVVADVSGKGIPGSMVMTIMRTVLNIAAIGNLSCRDCLGKTNRFLSDRIKRGMFVTSFYAILDCKKNVLRFSSAGHNPMVVHRAKTGKIELFNPTGIALGFDKGSLFNKTIKEQEITLEPGDRFVLYTDGVVESMNEKRKEYTDQRFYDFVKKYAALDSKQFVKKLVSDLKKHQGKAPQHDDITIVTFRKN